MTKIRNKTLPTRIIFARDSFPYLGGSSTFLYLLFELLQRQLPNAECWNIISSRKLETGQKYFGPHWPNPRNLSNVYTFVVDDRRGRSEVRKALHKKNVAAILSKSRKTTAFLKDLAPGVPVWHLTSTCSIVKNAVAAGRFPSMEHVIRQLRSGKFPPWRHAEEQQAVRAADRIICHTKNMQFWYNVFYPDVREKVVDEIFWDYPLLQKQFKIPRRSAEWNKRPIDLIFVATDWARGEKNFKLLKRLCTLFWKKKIMVIGFLPEKLPAPVMVFDTMSQYDAVQAMGLAKVLVCPLRYDEAPNVLFEAALAGTNIVCSRNCGNYHITDEKLVARLAVGDFVRKIKTALQKYYPPQTEDFTRYDLGEWIIEQLGIKRGS